MFDFSDIYKYDKEFDAEYVDEQIFEDLFIKWYDAGKPEHNFDENLMKFLIWDWTPEDILYDEPRRWTRWVDHIIKIKDRYFMIGYDQGLTEMQEDLYDESDITEVKPKMVVKVMREWEEINGKENL